VGFLEVLAFEVFDIMALRFLKRKPDCHTNHAIERAMCENMCASTLSNH